jgi:hypothetical protein
MLVHEPRQLAHLLVGDDRAGPARAFHAERDAAREHDHGHDAHSGPPGVGWTVTGSLA